MSQVTGTTRLLEPDPATIVAGADIERDAADRIVRCGLTLRSTAHRSIIGGREYYTCAPRTLDD